MSKLTIFWSTVEDVGRHRTPSGITMIANNTKAQKQLKITNTTNKNNKRSNTYENMQNAATDSKKIISVHNLPKL